MLTWLDGQLHALKKTYDERISFVRSIGHERSDEHCMERLNVVSVALSEDRVFLIEGHEGSREQYEKKRNQQLVPEETLFALAWKVIAFEALLKQNYELSHRVSGIANGLGIGNSRAMFSKELTSLREELVVYSKGALGKKRTAASHVFVYMIADEQRRITGSPR